MTDVLLFHEDDGGNINFVNGAADMSAGLEGAAYLSMFGGNEQDSGEEADDPLEWWGNKTESVPTKKYRSRTQNLLRSFPIVPGNLRRLEEAAGLDLAWFVEDGPASYVGVVCSIPGLNRVRWVISVVIDDEKFSFEFTYRDRSREQSAA
jgi:phage gp46-like protein